MLKLLGLGVFGAIGAFGALSLYQLSTDVTSSPKTVVLNQPKVPVVNVIELPQRIIEQEAVSAPLEPISQLHWSNLEVKSGDSLTTLFRDAKILPAELSAALNIGEHSRYLKRIYPGQQIKILRDDDGRLHAIEQQIDEFKSLQIERKNNKFVSTLIEAPIENKIAFGQAIIQDSLFLDGKRANLEDKLIMELADIFAYDIDFSLDIRPEDSFKVLFEEKYVDGKKIGVGPILSAEFINQGKSYQAVRFTDDNGNSSYYTPNGKSLKKAFIRSPVKYTRISSHFNLKRKHPVLHKIRAHKGVDYAAPRGTPIQASGDGKVIFAGHKGGYGNTVIIEHGPKYTTLYAHMHKFAKNIKTGSRVKQGQKIGSVGSSGLATGPHLHYEFRINGSHRNPLTVALPQSNDIIKVKRDEYLMHSKNLLALMDHHHRVMLAQSEFE